MPNIALWILLIMSLIFLSMVIFKVFQKKTGWRTFILIAGILLIVYSVVGIAGSYGMIDLTKVGAEKLFLVSTGVSMPSDKTVDKTNPTIDKAKNPNTETPTGVQFVIGTLKVNSKEKYSNSYTNVGNATVGYLYIYDAGTDPTQPTASYIDLINISSGVGTSTNKLLQTNTPYRVIFNGGGAWYDKDFGVMTFDSTKYNAQTSELLFSLGEISKIATVPAFLNGTAVDGSVNGQTSYTLNTEVMNTSTATRLYINQSTSDGQFYINPTFAVNGANTELKNPVVCFEWDTTTPPNGNELSSITAQLLQGSDLGIPSELVNYWAKAGCVALGSQMTGGASSQYKLTFTMDKSKVTTGQGDYYLYLDDLGSIRGKDSALNTGASSKKIEFSIGG